MMEAALMQYVTLVGSLLLPIAGCVILHNGLARLLGGLVVRSPLSRWAYVGLGCVGIPLHELSHAIAALLFGHRITRIQWVGFGYNGLTGHVEHRWNSRSIYQRIGLFWIGVAPMLTAIALSVFVAGDTLLKSPYEAVTALKSWELFVIALVSFYCIPSFADLKSATIGGLALLLVLLVVSMLPGFGAWLDMAVQWIGQLTVAISIIAGLSVLGWVFFCGLSVVELSLRQIR